MMAKREKKQIHKVQMTEGKRQIIQQLLQEYDIETAEDIQTALKDLLGGTINVPTLMTTGTATRRKQSIRVTALCGLTFPKTANPPLSQKS